VKRQLQSIGEDFNSRLSRASTFTKTLINELADRIQEHPAEVEEQLARQDSLKKFSEAAIHDRSVVECNLGHVNAKVSVLEFKFNEQPSRQISASEVRAVRRDTISPFDGQVDGHTRARRERS
jgi:hypothetical protein